MRIEKADNPLHEQFIRLAAQGVWRGVVRVAFYQLVSQTQPLTQIMDSAQWHRRIRFTVMNTDRGVDAV